jgi:hypothetical protein
VGSVDEPPNNSSLFDPAAGMHVSISPTADNYASSQRLKSYLVESSAQ